MKAETRNRWLARWDAQQEYYVADREERFQVVADVVRWSARRDGVSAPKIVDLGCGPGSLGARVATALPTAEIVGIDSDPLLLALASGPEGSDGAAGARVRSYLDDLTSPRWTETVKRAGLDVPWDAAVSATALHWLRRDQLASLYKTIAVNLRDGGVFVDLDHREPSDGTVADLAQAISARRAARAGVTFHETWGAWWEAAQEDPDLRPLIDSRSDSAISHNDENGLLSVEVQSDMLRDAGFGVAATVWQCGTDYILAAIR